MLKKSKNNLLFSIYTRLVCNFVLPELKTINAYSRFKIIKEEDKKDYEDQDIDDLNMCYIILFNEIDKEHFHELEEFLLSLLLQ